MNNTPSVSYHPALRGGVPVFPVNVMAQPQGGVAVGGGNQGVNPQSQLSPQVKRRTYGQTPPNQSTPTTRPISFVRALEMTDSIEMLQQDGSGGMMSKSVSDKLGNGGGGMSKGGGLGGSSDRLLGGSGASPRIVAAGGAGQNGGILVGGQGQQGQGGGGGGAASGDRAASVYDMNYEISV